MERDEDYVVVLICELDELLRMAVGRGLDQTCEAAYSVVDVDYVVTDLDLA